MRGSAIVLAVIAVGLLAGGMPTKAGSASGANETTGRQSAEARNGQRDFDFNFGTWKTHVSRLEAPLTDSTAWLEYEGVAVVSRVWDGSASLLELDVKGPAGRIQGLGLRLYNPESRQWSLNWASSADGVMTRPLVGGFRNGKGEFFNQESFNGRMILVRNSFVEIKRDSSRFEQAFSDDGGKTWETNWIMTFTRLEGAAAR